MRKTKGVERRGGDTTAHLTEKAKKARNRAEEKAESNNQFLSPKKAKQMKSSRGLGERGKDKTRPKEERKRGPGTKKNVAHVYESLEARTRWIGFGFGGSQGCQGSRSGRGALQP